MLKKLREFKLMERSAGGRGKARTFRYPGIREAVDGNAAVIACEREAADAAGAYPITPSTQMGEYWAEAAARGHVNVSGRRLMFVEPESEHAAAGVTAGMAMSGLRATNFSSAQGVAFMHESLYAAAGKRLPYVLNMGCRAITKASLNVHCAHDDYHCVDDTGFIQVMAATAQEAADLNLIARKTAELALTPAIVAQDGFLTTHLIESVRLPERELIAEYLGRPEDLIETPTPAQRLLYGERRRRVPAIWDIDNVMQSGVVQNQDAYMQACAAQRPYFYEHVEALAERCMDEYFELTGRRYARVSGYRCEDAEYLIVGMGSMIVQAQAVADWLREKRGVRLGVVNLTMYRPFPGDRLAALLEGRRAVAVLERTDQPLAEDLPLMRELRAALGKCLENGAAGGAERAYPGYPAFTTADLPALYSGCYGLGSRDLQPEALIGAVENMLPNGPKRRFFYLSVDFVRETPANPKEEIRQQRLLESYPRIAQLAVHGSENPDLMPAGAITVRMHSVGGWGAITTGKNLAVTLFDLLGWEIRANPKYGSEKKGQPTTYYLSAAPEPIRVNCEYRAVDVVISPDPNVFEHSDPLAGLKRGGVFIVQSPHEDAAQVWASFPQRAREYIREHDIRVFWIDAFRIAREEASNPELQLRMQGNAFQGAFFAASPVMEQAGFTEERLFAAIRAQIEAKFGGKGARVVEDNLRVVGRGFRELRRIDVERQEAAPAKREPRAPAGLPVMLKRLPEGGGGVADVQRFWAETGSFYAGGKGGDILADPFVGLSIIPAATGALRDLTQIRFEHPAWKPEKCTACGNCYVACPDSAMPGLASTVGDVLETALRRVETGGRPTRYLRRALRAVEKDLRAAMRESQAPDVRAGLDAAIAAAVERAGEEREKLAAEFALLRAELGDFSFAITKPYFTTREKKAAGSGALFNVSVNPYTCKACALCVEVCEDGALEMVPQTPQSVARLKRDWGFWLDLPSTPREYIRIDSLDEKIGALETLLLDKRNYTSMACGDGACLGCGEKTAIHLFTSTVRALMQPRVRAFVAKLDELIDRLEKHIRMKLTESLDLSQPAALAQAAEGGGELTLASLSARLSEGKAEPLLDPQWVHSTGSLLDALRDLRARYTEGGRAEMGMVNSTGCTSVWGSTYPYNPYPFPWTSHLFQDSPSVAMGIFQGHMAKMAEAFKAVRRAELELAGEYDPATHDAFFASFDWNRFSEEEWRLCPPVVALGGDGAMYDIGFQNLSRALISGMPIKVVVLDTQVYSNTGGQACTSGFIGQVSDMAPYGAANHGKQETRKEIGLIAAAHRTAFVLQSSIAHPTHLIEGFIDGLNSRRPALFNLYAVCPPEHGVADDQAVERSRLAVESRAYPLMRFDPDAGAGFADCVSLEGNPAIESDWPRYRLEYRNEDGSQAFLDVPMTFADFAAGEARFAKQFRAAPPETWNEDMIGLADLLDLPRDAREGRIPYIWAVDAGNRLVRLLVSEELVRAAEERLRLWRQLKGLAGLGRAALDEEAIASRARTQLVEELAATLARIGGGAALPASAPAALQAGAAPAGAAPAEFEPAWVDSPECTACDECTTLAPKIFAYDENKHARVVDPRGGRYADIVKAAEKCTAGCIHPGTPWNPAEPGLDRLVARAAKYH
ncbi:MAG: hypothetical protein Fur0039_10440 [Rhodocyclaceae bacterium]